MKEQRRTCEPREAMARSRSAVVAVHHIDELSHWKKCPNGNADCIATFTPSGAGPAYLDLPKFSVLTRACVVKLREVGVKLA